MSTVRGRTRLRDDAMRVVRDGYGDQMGVLAKASVLPALALILFCILRVYPSRPGRGVAAQTAKLLDALATADAGERQRVVGDTVAWTGFARVYSRQVLYEDGHNVTFDVWGRCWRDEAFAVAIVVPFDRLTRTFTLVREFCIAHGRHVYSFPAGQVEKKHGGDATAAAVAELEEEAHLKCATRMRKLVTMAAPQDKFQREVVHYFLCDRIVPMSSAALLDPEERIDIVGGVKAATLLNIVRAGGMQSNMMAAALLAMDDLRLRRFL